MTVRARLDSLSQIRELHGLHASLDVKILQDKLDDIQQVDREEAACCRWDSTALMEPIAAATRCITALYGLEESFRPQGSAGLSDGTLLEGRLP